MGHSMGAGTTCNIAMEYPGLPGAIILEDPAWGLFPQSRKTQPRFKRTMRKYGPTKQKWPNCRWRK